MNIDVLFSQSFITIICSMLSIYPIVYILYKKKFEYNRHASIYCFACIILFSIYRDLLLFGGVISVLTVENMKKSFGFKSTFGDFLEKVLYVFMLVLYGFGLVYGFLMALTKGF